ncbi:MAG: nitrate/nitrite sensor protein [Caldimonas sp.]|uniref:type IV pili methyl-accepting chemotaxis transducer N-terminal domain-containing protein n=1 Tax=Caldimonas TaxID=196013 RepID=UPI00039A9C28|nr:MULTISPECIES: type IV pili methyl-accepting chemotaxis transducer N-terminal domain-containing protein [Caldimonas]GIX24151.1 MAG: nitrate/nitrite sensor protein [Caldimonas sp.]GIX26079.1 MAG: nitrate/nitrite sensor protein [Caldimonas sp.]
MRHRPWTLATKLVLLCTGFLLAALTSIGLTLWITWQIEGGAAAVNEAGRLRMKSYQLALEVERRVPAAQIEDRLQRFDEGLALLRAGDPSRPLFVPWSQATRESFESVQSQWTLLREYWRTGGQLPGRTTDVDRFVAAIDGFVAGIEYQLSLWTAILHAVQLGILALALMVGIAMMYAGYLLVLNPVNRLQQGLKRVQAQDFAVRVEERSSAEFDQLAQGFNRMAETLQALYANLENKVAEKTARLQQQRERLAALYETSAMMAEATSLDELARQFAQQVRRIARADAVAVRWSDEANQRYLLLAGDCLPHFMTEQEQCVQTGSCHCGQALEGAATRIIPIKVRPANVAQPVLEHCAQAGYQTLVSVPVRLQHRLLGEVDIFFREETTLGDDERSLLEALAAHLAGAMEGLRAEALGKEAAVAQERSLLAQELHDSIAQSLAFLKIQVQLLRDAMRRGDEPGVERVLCELDAGVRESYNDVRELLLHFRTRANGESIEPALRTTLQKFEHQSGLRAHLAMHGHGLPLDADVQIQVLHVVQEALSNVRKHAHAREVWVDVEQAPVWRFTVRDDGVGFDTDGQRPDETHVGLRIMRERAARIGATVTVQAEPGKGTCVTLTLPPSSPQPLAA